MTSHSLPTEIIENIVDEASDNPQTLCSLSLTCRELRPRSHYRLFHSPCLRDVTQLHLLCKVASLYPRVAVLIFSLTLSITRGDPKSPMSLLQAIPTPLLINLPNMRMWTISDPKAKDRKSRQWLSFSSPTLTCLKAHGTAIVELHLYSVSLQNCAHFAEYILAFRGLKILHCRDIRLKKDLDDVRLHWVVQRLAKQLRLSTLIIGENVPDDAAGALVQSSPSTLLHLELRVPQSAKFDIPAIVSEMHGLRSLTLTLQAVDEWSAYRRDDSAQTELVLRTFRIIKALTLYSNSRLQDLAIHLHCARILLLLDPLFNPASYPTLKCCRELEAVLLRLPRLRNIEIQHCDGSYDADLTSLLEEYLPKLSRLGTMSFKHPIPIHCREDIHDMQIKEIAVSPNSQRIVSCSVDGTIVLWDAQRRSVIHEWIAQSSRGGVCSLAFSPDSRRLASGCGNGQVVVWDISGPREKRVAVLEGHSSSDGAVGACAWSPDGTTLVSGSDDRTVRIWNARTYKQLYSLQHPSLKEVLFVRFSPNGRWIASGGPIKGTRCIIWDVVKGDLHAVLSAHRASINNAVFDLTTGRLATASTDNTVRIWDVSDRGVEMLVVLEHKRRVRDVAFSPDGRCVVSGSDDYRMPMKMWDSFRGDILLSFKDHPRMCPVTKVCFSPDGKYIASAWDWSSEDGGARVTVYTAGDGVCIKTFPTECLSIEHLVYSLDGETLTFTEWGNDSKVCIRRLCDVIPQEHS